MARMLLRRVAENGAGQRLIGLLERLDSARPSVLRVLTYHRVDAGEPFARQMEFLATRHRVVSVQQVLTFLDGGEPLPPRALLLTFDDAYRSFAEVAWPILRRHGFPAALFVPTAYPDSRAPRFWWDRIDQGFARTARRDELATPIGRFPLATAEERAAARVQVKRWVKDLPHAETLAATDELATELGLGPELHEVLGWDELRALAREGVSLGAHTRTHPRLDRVTAAEAREEILASVRDLEREVPDLPRIFAYPDGRFSDELVGCVRAAGVELAFTTRPGTSDLVRADRLRLRRANVDAGDSVPILRAKLVFSSPHWNLVRRLMQPPSRGERDSERSTRAERARIKLVYRSLDAALTAGLRPRQPLVRTLRGVASPKLAHYERVGRLVRLATSSGGLERRLRGKLLDPTRLGGARIELLGFGSGVTVFRFQGSAPGAPVRALKVYRRSLGRDPDGLLALARRYRQRYRRLREQFGEFLLPAEFVVLHGPLRGRPAVACFQELLPGRLRDPLALEDSRLVELLRSEGDLAAQFADFARRALAWHAAGSFPDLLGRGNLTIVERAEGPRLQLIDYGVFDLRAPSPRAPGAALEAVAARLRTLSSRLEPDVALRR